MAFWKKKSVDPWDIDPEKRKKERKVQQEPQIPAWYRTEEPAEPEVCPWCGQPMLAGNLYSSMSRGVYQGLTWREGAHKSFLEAIGTPTQERQLHLGYYEEAWYCESCQKMMLDIDTALGSAGPNYQWKDGRIVFPDREETEE